MGANGGYLLIRALFLISMESHTHMELLEPIPAYIACNWVRGGKVPCIPIVCDLIIHMQCHINTNCQIDINLPTRHWVPLLCSCTRVRIVLRLSQIAICLLNYQIDDFWYIVYSKQSNWIIGRDVIR
jgi:hypothetical protein